MQERQHKSATHKQPRHTSSDKNRPIVLHVRSAIQAKSRPAPSTSTQQQRNVDFEAVRQVWTPPEAWAYDTPPGRATQTRRVEVRHAARARHTGRAAHTSGESHQTSSPVSACLLEAPATARKRNQYHARSEGVRHAARARRREAQPRPVAAVGPSAHATSISASSKRRGRGETSPQGRK